ncbi:MarR family winged helix-turn-helix transcriptional regulator [Brachybacterium kimchii]|uniref:MarR family transcriptional regulator n=1 Tax=Brachybacterium kimchii TaxID=2942909 RepID=A0ABY4N5X3_9MICO|nr:MarR family transcriptional regulator [Brachybacterium kimchii]UQN28729.1 MarR family transcriptional regulator [Brachybacterium kimchii]
MSTPLDPEELADRLAEVYVAIGPVYRTVARIVERSEPIMGMSTGVRNVLDQLRRGGDLTVPQLASAQDLSRQFVQRMVDDASAAGFVERRRNPSHRRSFLVHLTADGEAAIAAVAAREHTLMGQVGGELTGAEVDTTLRVLHHMQRALVAIDDRAAPPR